MATLLKPESRQQLMGHKSGVVWLTGLSGAGKSTIAYELELQLHRTGVHTYVLDGDNLRRGINADLGFTPADRTCNVLRTAQVARLMADAGLLVIVAMISPFSKDRLQARELLLPTPFVEVHVQAPLAVCEARDPKGLYQKARQGLLPDFTGIGSPYEAPSNPDLLLNTSTQSLQNCMDILMNKLKSSGLIPPRD